MKDSFPPGAPSGNIVIGQVRVPSGALAIYDVGVTAFVLSGEIPELPVVVVDGVPADRALDVVGVRVGADVDDGSWVNGWDHVAVRVSDGVVADSHRVGEVVVDFARVIFIDDDARKAWVHDASIDGLADVVFWGRDAAALAGVIGAAAIPDDGGTFGWLDVSVDEATAFAHAADAARVDRGFKLAMDFRPHSHHWRALSLVRASPHEAGTVEVGGADAVLWMTSWGDGVFEVFQDVDADGALVQIRVQLWVAEANAE